MNYCKNISNQEYSKDFTWHEGTCVFKWHEIKEGLYFQPESYAPKPARDKNGYPLWKRVIQYNACYLKKEGDFETSVENYKKLDPVSMWQEYRWIFLRRILGDEFVQKLFMRCIQWTYVCNDIKDATLYERQDAIVNHLFKENPTEWFRKYAVETYMSTWDGRYWGYVSKSTIQELAKRVNVFGPIAGIFGRDLEYEVVSKSRYKWIPTRVIENSIVNNLGSLNNDHFEEEPTSTNWSTMNQATSSSYRRSYE